MEVLGLSLTSYTANKLNGRYNMITRRANKKYTNAIIHFATTIPSLLIKIWSLTFFTHQHVKSWCHKNSTLEIFTHVNFCARKFHPQYCFMCTEALDCKFCTTNNKCLWVWLSKLRSKRFSWRSNRLLLVSPYSPLN